MTDEQIVKIALDLGLRGIPSTFVRFARAIIAADAAQKEHPMSAITTAAEALNKAATVLGAFTGTAQEASRSSVLGDAVDIITVLAPLVESFSRGVDVTPEDVGRALAGMGQKLDALDQEIARQGG